LHQIKTITFPIITTQ